MGFISPNSDNTVPSTWSGYQQLPLESMPRNRHLSGAVHDLFWTRWMRWTEEPFFFLRLQKESRQLSQLKKSSLLNLGDDRSYPCSLKLKSWFSLPKKKNCELPDRLEAAAEASSIPSSLVLSESKYLNNACRQHGNYIQWRILQWQEQAVALLIQHLHILDNPSF